MQNGCLTHDSAIPKVYTDGALKWLHRLAYFFAVTSYLKHLFTIMSFKGKAMIGLEIG